MIRNILLVDTAVPDYEVFIRSVNADTKAIPYSSTTYDEIRAAIPGPVDRLGIVFVKGAFFLGKPFTDQHEFFQSLVNQFELKRLDFLACETLPEWTDFYAKFTDVIIGASNNRTGNIQYGGDWTLESTMEDVEGIYFTNSIHYYKYLLDLGSHIFAVKNGILHGYGMNNSSQLGVQSFPLFNTLTPIPLPVQLVPGAKVVSGRDNTFLLNNGILYGCGANTISQLVSSTLDLNGLLTSLTQITTPPGTVTNVFCHERNVAIIVNGRMYGMGYIYGEPSNFIELPGLENKVSTKIVFGGDYQLAIADGELYGRGSNWTGQLGGSYSSLDTWTKIDTPAGIVTDVACGMYHTMVVIDGALYGMGYNAQNQLGYEINVGDENRTLTKIKYLGVDTSGVTQVAAYGTGTTLIVMNNQLYGTGSNPFDIIGLTGARQKLTLVPLPSGATGPIQNIVIGESHMMVQINNVLYTAGNTNVTFISTQHLGPVKLEGNNTTNVTSISAGVETSVAIINNVLYGWGKNQKAQLGIDPRMEFKEFNPISINGVPITGVTQTSSGSTFSLIIKDGIAYGAGNNFFDGRIGFGNQPWVIHQFTPVNYPVGASGTVTHVSCGQGTSVIVRNNRVYTTGGPTNVFVERALPEGITGPIEAVSTGFDHTLFNINGKLYGYGVNTNNRLGGEPGNTNQYTTIRSVENSTFTIPSGSRVTHIATSDACSFFVMNNKIYGVGRNDTYILTDSVDTVVNTITEIPFPVNVPTSTPIDAIHAGYRHFVAVIGGIAYGRGANWWNNLGNQQGLGSPDNDNLITTLLPIRFNGNTFTSDITNVFCTYDSTYLFKSTSIYKVSSDGLIPILTGIDLITSTITFETITGSTTVNNLTGTAGTVLTVTGTLLNNISTVFIQDVNTCTITNRTPTSITFTIPAGTGVRSLKFTDNTNTTYVYSTPFTYINPMSITSSSTFNNLNYGPNGVTFRIIGDVLTQLNTIKFGEAFVPVELITKTPTLVTFPVPNGTGSVIPVVTDLDEKTYTLAAFHYSNPMVITSLSQTTGNANGLIQITGVNLTALRSVQFGNVNTINSTTLNTNVVSVNIPPRGTQNKGIMIYVKDQYGTESNGLAFTYVSMEVTSIQNEQGDSITKAVCGTKVKLIGTNLLTVTKIVIGATTRSATAISRTTSSLTFTVPNVIGEMTIRLFDSNSNMFQLTQKLDCTLATTTVSEFPTKVTHSTNVTPLLPLTLGVIHYVMDDKTIRTLDASNAFVQIATHENVIMGIASYTDQTTQTRSIYFGDATRTPPCIYVLDKANNKTLFYENTLMSPMAIKVAPPYMYVVCANKGATSYALLKLSILTKTILFALTYAQILGYQLRNIAIPKSTDTKLYLSAVPFNVNEYDLSQGRVIQLNVDGTISNTNYITNLQNPKDLALYNGYLAVDGNLEFFDPSGNSVSRFITEASTITVDGDTAYFTSDVGTRSVLNRIIIEPYRNLAEISVDQATPTRGPKGTLVFVSGTSMVSNILSITIGGTTFSDYWVSDVVLTLRMPDLTGEVPIVITYTGGSKTFTYTYASSDIINVIPLYTPNPKHFHFTGNNLLNIVYVDFVNTQTNDLTSSKRLVYNNTDTSFDCSFTELPVNSTRIIMVDAYGTTTIEDAATFTLSSETCFLGGTPVLTDQGEVAIDKIDPEIHTLGKKEILAITKIRYNGSTLVRIEQDSLRRKYPTRDTIISRKHKIYYKGKMKTAESLVGHNGVEWVPYKGEFLYNVLLNTHEKMNVNGLICETLHPKNPIVKYFI